MVNKIALRGLGGLLLVVFLVACSSVKHLDLWKDEAYTGQLDRVLLVAVAREGFIRNQVEDVMANQLKARGIDAIPSHTVLPLSKDELNREVVLEKVQELGIRQVLVARAIQHKTVKNHQTGGAVFAPTSVYNDGWYTYYVGSILYPEREYDTDIFVMAINVFDVASKKAVWTDVSQVKVSGSRQAAVNIFVPKIVEQLEKSRLINKRP